MLRWKNVSTSSTVNLKSHGFLLNQHLSNYSFILHSLHPYNTDFFQVFVALNGVNNRGIFAPFRRIILFLTPLVHFAPRRTPLSLGDVFIATKLARNFLSRLFVWSRNSRFYFLLDCNALTSSLRQIYIDTLIQDEISNSQKLLGSLLILYSKYNAITDTTITQAVTKISLPRFSARQKNFRPTRLEACPIC